MLLGFKWEKPPLIVALL